MSIEALNWALSAPLGGTSKIILLGLANHASADFGNARPSVPTLALYANCDRRTVQRHLRSLEVDGWIVPDGGYAVHGRADRVVTVWRLTGRQDVAPCGDGATSEADGAALVTKRGVIAMTPEPPKNHPEPLSPTDSVVRSLFDYWREQTGHNAARLSADRRRAVAARLKEDYTPEQIRAAIDGAAAQPYVNDVGKVFDDLALICRNGSKLEDFIARATFTPQRPVSQKSENERLQDERRAVSMRLLQEMRDDEGEAA